MFGVQTMSEPTSDPISFLSRLALLLTSSKTFHIIKDVAGTLSSLLIPGAIGDLAIDAMEQLWKKGKRERFLKTIKKRIKGLLIYRAGILTEKQKEIIANIATIIQKNRKLIIDAILQNRSFTDIIVEILSNNGLELALAKELAPSLEVLLSKVLVEDKDDPISQLLLSVKGDTVRILQFLEKWTCMMFPKYEPSAFVFLPKFLKYDEVLHELGRSRKGLCNPPMPRFFRRPRINWLDLDNGYYYERSDVIRKIEDNFSDTNMQMILAESGAGKTTLSFIYGYELIKRNAKVYYVNLEEKSDIINDIGNIVVDHARSMNWSNGFGLGNRATPDVLFIVDNIQVNLEVARDIYRQYKWSQFAPQEDEFVPFFLFLARSIFDDLEESMKYFMGQITETSLSSDSIEEKSIATSLLNTVILEENDFSSTVRGIISKFRDKESKDFHEHLDKITKKSQRSLWLLSFIINGLMQGQNIDAIDLWEEFRKYYFDPKEPQSLLSRILMRVFGDVSNRPRKEQLFTSLLGTIAFYNSLDVPVPLDYFLQFGKDTKSLEKILGGELEFNMNRLLSQLANWGELITHTVEDWEFLSLPHKTLAKELWQSISSDPSNLFFVVEESNGNGLSTEEQLAIALLKWCNSQEPGRTRLLPWIIDRLVIGNLQYWNKSQYVPTFLLECLDVFVPQLEKASLLVLITSHLSSSAWDTLFAKCLELSENPLQILQAINFAISKRSKILHIAIKKSITKIAHSLEIHPTPWRVLRGIALWNELRDSEVIRMAIRSVAPKIAAAIETSSEPWWILDAIKGWDNLRDDQTIQSAIVHTIKRHPIPWLIFKAIKPWDRPQYYEKILEHEKILASSHAFEISKEPWKLLDSMEKWQEPWWAEVVPDAVAEAIEISSDPRRLLSVIHFRKELRDDKRIREAIARVIEKRSDILPLLDVIFSHKEFRDDKRIQAAIRKAKPAIVDALRAIEDPWTILSTLEMLEELLADETINSIIDQVLNAQSASSNLVGAIYSWMNQEARQTSNEWISHFWDSPVIREAIARVIEASPEPWWLLWSMQFQGELRNDNNIREAIQQSTTKIAQAIETSRKPWLVLEAIRSYRDELYSNEVQLAIAHAIESSPAPDLILQVADWIDTKDGDAIQLAIAHKIDEFVHNKEVKKSFGLIGTISTWPDLLSGRAINDAIVGAIPQLCDAIKSWLSSSFYMDDIMHIPQIRDDERIKECLKEAGLYEKYYT